MVYGTKQIDKFDPPQGFHVSDIAEKQACGLTVDTVFDLQDNMILPWSPIYFSNQHNRPIIGGRLTVAMQARLKEQAAQLK